MEVNSVHWDPCVCQTPVETEMSSRQASTRQGGEKMFVCYVLPSACIFDREADEIRDAQRSAFILESGIYTCVEAHRA